MIEGKEEGEKNCSNPEEKISRRVQLKESRIGDQHTEAKTKLRNLLQHPLNQELEVMSLLTGETGSLAYRGDGTLAALKL